MAAASEQRCRLRQPRVSPPSVRRGLKSRIISDQRGLWAGRLPAAALRCRSAFGRIHALDLDWCRLCRRGCHLPTHTTGGSRRARPAGARRPQCSCSSAQAGAGRPRRRRGHRLLWRRHPATHQQGPHHRRVPRREGRQDRLCRRPHARPPGGGPRRNHARPRRQDAHARAAGEPRPHDRVGAQPAQPRHARGQGGSASNCRQHKGAFSPATSLRRPSVQQCCCS